MAIRQHIYTCLVLAALVLLGTRQAYGQQFRVAGNKMVVWVPEKITEDALDSFLVRYNLNGIGIREFILSGNRKLLTANEWDISKSPDRKSYVISKWLAVSTDLSKPSQSAVFDEIATPPNWQQRIGNREIFGVNYFKDGKSFSIQDSIVTFILRCCKDQEKVRLAGSFTNWQNDAFPMTLTDSGWVVKVKLRPGKYFYKFILNDDHWITDPMNQQTDNDGQGNTNSVFFVNNHVFSLQGHTDVNKVFVSGSFNEWDTRRTAMIRTNYGWILPAFLGEGTYAYHFITESKPVSDTQVAVSGPKHWFVVKGYTNAKTVSIQGSFNSWKKGGSPMQPTKEGWVLDYALGPGNYSFHAIVDGKKQADSFLVIGANYTFRLKGYANAKKVTLAGEFNGWNPDNLIMRREGDEWIFSVYLAKGKHLYKFIVDGDWLHDPASKQYEDNDNSVIWMNE